MHLQLKAVYQIYLQMLDEIIHIKMISSTLPTRLWLFINPFQFSDLWFVREIYPFSQLLSQNLFPTKEMNHLYKLIMRFITNVSVEIRWGNGDKLRADGSIGLWIMCLYREVKIQALTLTFIEVSVGDVAARVSLGRLVGHVLFTWL